MRFRPCIDIHDGKVKQIVGSTLHDGGATENFTSEKNAEYFASLYRSHGLYGGHIIILNKSQTPEYEADKLQAFAALREFKNGLQIGGGINDKNAEEFLNAGASHVIVTSFVFSGGKIDFKNLEALKKSVGKENIVLDLSCRKKGDDLYIVTDLWQTFTNVQFNEQTADELSSYCDEFLVHAVDSEGKQNGIDDEVLNILSKIKIPVTYAGGISSLEDIRSIDKIGKSKVDFTVGSALDLFGGKISFEVVSKYNK